MKQYENQKDLLTGIVKDKGRTFKSLAEEIGTTTYNLNNIATNNSLRWNRLKDIADVLGADITLTFDTGGYGDDGIYKMTYKHQNPNSEE